MIRFSRNLKVPVVYRSMNSKEKTYWRWDPTSKRLVQAIAIMPTNFPYVISTLTIVDPEYPTTGEPTGAAYDGNDTIYISTYFPTTTDNAVIAYSISAKTASVYLTKAQSTNSTYGIAYDSVNSCLYLGNLGANTIVKMTVPGKVKTTLTTTNISRPYDISFDGSSYLYVCNNLNHTIARVDVTNGNTIIFAGAAGSAGSTDGALTTARFRNPVGIVCDGTTAIYVADSGNYTIRKITLATSQVSTIAGLAGSSGSTDGIGNLARFSNMRGLSIDGTKQNLYVTDESNSIIRQINLATNSVIRIAGVVGITGDTISSGGDALNSTLNLPRGVIYINPYLYILDTRNNKLKQLQFS